MAAEFNDLCKLTDELMAQLEDFRPDLIPENLKGLTEKLKQGYLTLAVLGQFKRGKSTLINALLEAEVMPASVLPLTSVLTVAHYGDEPGVTIHFAGGRTEERPVAELAQFVTEENNPRNVRGVEWVETRWPCSFLKRPVRIVDTPGVGSIYAHNTATAEAFLDRLDAAVFVLGVDPVLTQTEIEWLQKVKDQGERFFFVLNKIDRLSGSEVEQVMAFAHERIRELWGNPGRIYALSARSGLLDPDDSAFGSFRRDLENFLDREGRATLWSASRKKVERAISKVLSVLALERQAADRPVDELLALLRSLNGLMEELTLERARAYWVMDEAQTGLLMEAETIFDERWESVKGRAREEVEEAWSRAGTIGRGRMNMAEALEKRFKDLFSGLRAQGETVSERHFTRAGSYLLKEYQGLVEALVRETRDKLELDLPALEMETPEPRPVRFYVDLPPELTEVSSAGGSVVNLLPRALGGWAKRAFIRRLEEFYAMHKARLLTDLADRFQERCAGQVTGLIQATKEILSGVKQAVERGASLHERSEQERTATIAELTRREAALNALLSRARSSDGAETEHEG